MKMVLSALMAVIIMMSSASAADDADLTPAREAAQALGAALKGALVQAMRQGGPKAAIEVCNVDAIPLGQQISLETGWQVARTSLKVRNPNNAADAWEREQLEHFARQVNAGVPASSLEVHATQKSGGNHVQRYMKAIVIQGPCLACHGQNLAPDVRRELDRLYPNDQARGYQAGDLRGAFTLSRDIP